MSGKRLVLCRTPILLPLLILGGCGAPVEQSPVVSSQSTAEEVTKPEAQPTSDTATKPTANLSSNKQSPPSGWVRIVNRKAGIVTWIYKRQNGLNRVEPAGDCFKIRCQDSGEYLALKDWAAKGQKAPRGHPGALRVVQDEGEPSMLWKLEPLEGGYWRIVNLRGDQCLEPVNPKSNLMASVGPRRDGALEQQWRLESISATVTKDSNCRAVPPKSPTQPTATPNCSEDALRLVALTDLIWVPKRESYDPRRKRSPVVTEEFTTKKLFQVFKGNEGPKDGFFAIDGKPLAPVWKSSNPSVLSVNNNAQGKPSFAVDDPGKATVTVLIGSQSLCADLEIRETPISLGMPRHDVVESHGYPSRKYQWRSGRLPSGFEPLPHGCCGILETGRRQGHVVAWKSEELSRDDLAGEYWEYSQWSRCLILVGEERVKSIVTLPPRKGDKATHAVRTAIESESRADENTNRALDLDQLKTGNTGFLECAYVEIIKVIDDRTCIVLPYVFVQWSDFNPYTGLPNQILYDYRPKLPLLLKGWSTSGKATGQKVDLDKTTFRVIGTEDVKKGGGSVVRVHVLRLVE